MPKVISNSSPVIHLFKMGYGHLLENLYEKVHITDCVFEECTEAVVNPGEAKEIEAIKSASFFDINTVENQMLFLAFAKLVDEGEASAIALAIEKKADLLLLDDQAARELADMYNLQYTGTIGVLLAAMEKGLIDLSVREILNKLRSTGFYIGKKIEAYILSNY